MVTETEYYPGSGIQKGDKVSQKSAMWRPKNEGDERRSGKDNPLKRDG